MIPHISEKENLENAVNTNFISAIKELGISGLLGQCGIRKNSRRQKGEASSEKRTAFEIFQFLLLMVFQGCSLYRFHGLKKQDIACSKTLTTGYSMTAIITGAGLSLCLRPGPLHFLTR